MADNDVNEILLKENKLFKSFRAVLALNTYEKRQIIKTYKVLIAEGKNVSYGAYNMQGIKYEHVRQHQ